MASPRRGHEHRVWARRLGWLILIWTAERGCTLAVVAALLRTVMNFAGLTL
jgi:hypothetical protein